MTDAERQAEMQRLQAAWENANAEWRAATKPAQKGLWARRSDKYLDQLITLQRMGEPSRMERYGMGCDPTARQV